MFDRLVPSSELPTRSQGGRRPFVVDEGVEFEGELRFAGTIRVDGLVTGRIAAERVIVGSGGEVHGVVVADEVVIDGISTAEVYADRIVLRPGSTVTGEIYHEDLLIEPHAHFEGKSRRQRAPQSIAPQKVEIVDDPETAVPPETAVAWRLDQVA